MVNAVNGKFSAQGCNLLGRYWGGGSMPGDLAPPQGGPMGAVLGVLLRNYGFTDFTPLLTSLLPPPSSHGSDPR